MAGSPLAGLLRSRAACFGRKRLEAEDGASVSLPPSSTLTESRLAPDTTPEAACDACDKVFAVDESGMCLLTERCPSLPLCFDFERESCLACEDSETG